MDVIVARQLNIPVWDIEDVPKVVYELYWHTYYVETLVAAKNSSRGMF
jgi:hypothetical protein